jgi:hypothetical protein
LLEPLIKELASRKIKIHAFNINQGATLTFTEMQKIYLAENSNLLFKINHIELDSEFIDGQAQEMTDQILEKLQIEVDDFLENSDS